MNELIVNDMDFEYMLINFSKFWETVPMRIYFWGILRPLLFLFFIIILFTFISEKNGTTLLVKSWISLAIVSCIYSIYQLIAFKYGLPFGDIFSGHESEDHFLINGARRTEGLFYEAGPHAAYLSIIFSILFFQLFEDRFVRLYSKKITVLLLILVSTILYFTYSPVAFLTPLIVFLLFLAIKKHFRKKGLLVSITIIVSVLIFNGLACIINDNINAKTLYIVEYIPNKIQGSLYKMDSSIGYGAGSRAVRNYAGVKIFMQHKIFGCGPGGAITYFFSAIPFVINSPIYNQIAVINTYLKMLCEVGIVGFIPFLMLIFYPIVLFIKHNKLLRRNNLICGEITAYINYIFVPFLSNFILWAPIFWMLYVLVIVSIKQEISKYRRNIIGGEHLYGCVNNICKL